MKTAAIAKNTRSVLGDYISEIESIAINIVFPMTKIDFLAANADFIPRHLVFAPTNADFVKTNIEFPTTDTAFAARKAVSVESKQESMGFL